MKINAATTKSQLAEYALNELGFKLESDLTRDAMIAAIREAEGGTPSAADLAAPSSTVNEAGLAAPSSTVNEAGLAAPSTTVNDAGASQEQDDEDDAPAGTIEALVRKEKKLKLADITDFTRCRATILVHPLPAHDEESEPDTHVTIGYNGVFYQVITGEEVEVPYGVYDILKNTRQTRYFSKKNPLTGHTETHSKEVLRFPHNLISVTVVE
ncbi:MAG TPA: hypothetical protein DF774_02195 [Rheinheimera sp.]|uniref:hypothetical protein n=1 Tax=Rheinheimera sp. TaxID=1869214 RepID=UPI000EC13D60|nr:hypothetical protein [Rheinheimera sp.]HCU64551.1 hypothetical protein [Rheinheimera sp.]